MGRFQGWVLGALAAAMGAAAPEEHVRWCGVEGHGPHSGSVSSVHEALLAAPASSNDAPAVLDILFVHSEKTREYHRTRLPDVVRRAVEGANVIFHRSGVGLRLRAVGLVPSSPEVDVREDRVRDEPRPEDAPVAAPVPFGELAESHGADLVYYLGRYTGKYGFSAAANGPSSMEELESGHKPLGSPVGTGYIYPSSIRAATLAHEVGHNLSLQHGERLDSSVPLVRGGRAFEGYLPDGHRYGTAMLHSGNKRERRFSSSRARYNGRRVGYRRRHEATEVLRFAAPYAAAWQPSKFVEEESPWPCAESRERDCMAWGRFSFRASYRSSSGEWLPARALDVGLGDHAGMFSFSGGESPDLLLVLEDACSVSGHYGVFGSAASEVAWEVEVVDLSDGAVQRYSGGGGAGPVSDGAAFACGEESSAGGVASWWSGGSSARAPASAAAASAESAADPRSNCADTNLGDCQAAGRFEVFVEDKDGPGNRYWSWTSVRDALIGDHASLFEDGCVDDTPRAIAFKCGEKRLSLVKVVDRCADTGYHEVFATRATTGRTYRVRIVDHHREGAEKEWERGADEDPLIVDRSAFACSPAGAEPPPWAGSCESSEGTLCLLHRRYAVEAEWWTAGGERQRASVVPEGTGDSGLFSFFDPENWEILIKVLDGCAVNGHHWVYGASTTDVGYVIRVTDTVTGEVKEYGNEPGRPAAAITDAKAFSAACREE